jgi:hypothetical protein
MTRKEARELRAAMIKGSAFLDDQTASTAPDMFLRLKEDGSLISAGTRINWNGVVKKATTDLWDTAENNPDNAPTLWADIDYRDGYRIIPEVITVTTAFAKDECGWWEDKLCRSLVDNNIYTPAQYASNWEIDILVINKNPSVTEPDSDTEEGYPEWVQPLSTSDAYNTGDIVSYNGVLYKSLIDGNTWSPVDYPAGWEQNEVN